jgi:hypothetical protein
MLHFLRVVGHHSGLQNSVYPVFFPVFSEFPRGDRVRCRLPPPPGTLSNFGISRFAPKGPELAGSADGAVVSAETNSGLEEI